MISLAVLSEIKSKLILMDEPTASRAMEEIEKLLKLCANSNNKK
jgi:ABC-type sugar transport system ATPase subunit